MLKMTQLSMPLMIMPRKTVNEKSRVRRVLFGERVDHSETRRVLEREMLKIQKEDTQRWNFNFAEFKPLEGRYDWIKVADCAASASSSTGTSSSSPASASSSSNIAGHRPCNADERCEAMPGAEPSAAAASAACAAANPNPGSSSGTRSRQSVVTDFFLRKRKRSSTTKGDSSPPEDSVAKLPKAS